MAPATDWRDGPPLLFISSFAKEAVGLEDASNDALARLRRQIWDLNESSLRRERPDLEHRPLAWVDELSGRGASPDGVTLAVADRLVRQLGQSAYYVCILGGQRTGDFEHGSPIVYRGQMTSVSYFEIELYAAAMHRLRPRLYVLRDFLPSGRLVKLLQVFDWAFGDWSKARRWGPDDVHDDIVRLIREHKSEPAVRSPPALRRIVNALWAARKGPEVPTVPAPGVLFLRGSDEVERGLPDPGRLETLIREYRDVHDQRDKLSRIWLAVRELMRAPYHPRVVARQPNLRAFLPYWDCVLGDWAAAASWYGWHGHLYAGTVAALNSQALLRAQAIPRSDEFAPRVDLPPDGALASAYYSVARLMGLRPSRWACLLRAGRHVQRAIEARGGPTDNLLAIRGSIRLQLGLWPSAASDFRRMLRLRGRSAASSGKIADARMHLGLAYALCPLSSKGVDLLSASVRELSAHPNDPNLPRAKRKLALAYRLRLDWARAERCRREAEEDARRLNALDQAR
jgi:hypothetical protein